MIQGLITVRTTSSRLPRKCLLPFGEDTNVIQHIIGRCKFYGIEPIVCTSTDSSDDVLADIANAGGVKIFRGSLINKLKRWYDCCTEFKIDSFHSVDADDPFFDGEIMKDSMQLLGEGYDVVCPTESSSDGAATVGYSLTSEIVQKAMDLTEAETDTEMMWFYLDKIPGIKKKVLPENIKNNYKIRLTLDYVEDYWLLETVRRILGNNCKRIEVDNLFNQNPDLYKVNWFRNIEWKNAQQSKEICKL
jgi:spore coat polysaccharide biosynthesis protein SpsF